MTNEHEPRLEQDQAPRIDEGRLRDDHNDRGSLTENGRKTEKSGPSLRTKLVVAGVAFAAAIGIGYEANSLRQGHPNKIAAPANPGETQPALTSEGYADQALKKATGREVVMIDSFIAEYDTSAQRSEVSNLGFERYELPKDAKINIETAKKIWNDYMAKQLSLYMNLIAKNQDSNVASEAEGLSAVDIIKWEFTHYSSEADNENTAGLGFFDDNEYVALLMDTLDSVVEKNGSTANYTVEPGSFIYDEPNTTFFVENDSTMTLSVDENNFITGFSDNADIAIAIDVYDGKTATKTIERLKNTQLSFIRQPNAPEIDFNYVSIGQIQNK